ncbi:MAG: tetratricopeptide repeat protein [Pseudomonadota bacterium]
MKTIKIAGISLLALIAVFVVVGIVANMQPRGPMSTQTSSLRDATIQIDLFEDQSPQVTLSGSGFESASFDEVLTAAENGSASAQQLMGTYYQVESASSVNGVAFSPLDLKESAYWYRQAAEQDLVDSQIYYAAALEHGKGVEKNLVKAREWYERAAEQDHTHAHFKLGFYYEQGIGGLEQDSSLGYKHTKIAANRGDAGAQVNLGVHYYHGSGVAKDMAKAASLFEQGALAGDSHGQYLTGHMYDRGYGVSQNSEQALHWYNKAAEQGHENAKIRLAALSEATG